MKYKRYLQKLLLILSFFVLSIFLLNYFIDPYGYMSRQNKFIKNISMVNNPQVINARINSDGFYYLIGTSRMSRIDPHIIEILTKQPTHNIKIDGATLRENYYLAQEIKKRNKNFIYGFDAFSLNITRNNYDEINYRFELYKNELQNNNRFTNFYNSDITIRSLQHLSKNLQNYPYNKKYIEENEHNFNYNKQSILDHTGIANNTNKKNFSNYKIYDEQDIIALAKLGTYDDIFIIFPKHFYHYQLFQKYQNIEAQYFKAIKLLVTNTNAKVWSFYGYNDITIDKKNFDDNGWHFKPKISELIFKKIFYKEDDKIPKNFGVLLTKSNIDSYLKQIHLQIEDINID